MILNCIGVTRITRQMLAAPDNIKKLEVESVEPNIAAEVRGNAFYFAYGNTAPLTLGAMVSEALEIGEQIFMVDVAIRVKTPIKDETIIRTLKELKRANVLALYDMRQPIADVITTHWHTWVASGAADDVLSEDDKNNKFTESSILRDMIARYPVFLDYLVNQVHFKHIKHILFKAYTEEGNLVYLLACFNDEDKYPDVPKNGIHCSAVGNEIPVGLPPAGQFVGGVRTIQH